MNKHESRMAVIRACKWINRAVYHRQFGSRAHMRLCALMSRACMDYAITADRAIYAADMDRAAAAIGGWPIKGA